MRFPCLRFTHITLSVFYYIRSSFIFLQAKQGERSGKRAEKYYYYEKVNLNPINIQQCFSNAIFPVDRIPQKKIEEKHSCLLNQLAYQLVSRNVQWL